MARSAERVGSDGQDTVRFGTVTSRREFLGLIGKTGVFSAVTLLGMSQRGYLNPARAFAQQVPAELASAEPTPEAEVEAQAQPVDTSPEFELMFFRNSHPEVRLKDLTQGWGGITNWGTWEGISSWTGRFLTQTRDTEPFPSGYFVLDTPEAKLWTAYQDNGGKSVLGYPLTQSWNEDGNFKQAFEYGIMQLTTDGQGQTIGVEISDPYQSLRDLGVDIYSAGKDHPGDVIPNLSDLRSAALYYGLIPVESAKPAYMESLEPRVFAEGIRFDTTGPGASFATWQRLAGQEGKPIWQFLIDCQRAYVGKMRRSMPLPLVLPIERWDTWAREEKMRTPDLLLQAFFADAPFDGSQEQLALLWLNNFRRENGLKPAVLHPVAVQTARVASCYRSIHLSDLFPPDGKRESLNIHVQIPGTVGFTGERPWDRGAYFTRRKVWFGENAGTPIDVVSGMQGAYNSPGHRKLLLNKDRPDGKSWEFGVAMTYVLWPTGINSPQTSDPWFVKVPDDRQVLGLVYDF